MVKQISVFLQNQPGMLNKAAKILADDYIDIRALTVAETADFGLLRMIVSNPDKAVEALKRGGLSAIEHEVLAVELDDKPGGLHRITEILLKDKVNIEYVYAFVTRRKEKAYVVLRTDDIGRAHKSLERNNIRLVSEKELGEL
jgi:hypothetical protein